jgi:hypothetical protein
MRIIVGRDGAVGVVVRDVELVKAGIFSTRSLSFARLLFFGGKRQCGGQSSTVGGGDLALCGTV